MALEALLRARGPYSLAASARLAGDRTRVFRDGVLTCVFEADRTPALARVWQGRDGLLRARLESEAAGAALDTLRFVLALEDDHTEFLRRFARDPLLGPATRRLQGLRPLRTATVTHALLRALCGQLITAREARRIEARLLRVFAGEHAGLSLPPRRSDFVPQSPAALSAHGLVARKAAALVRISRSLDLEKLHAVPTDVAVRRIVEERALGPWSAGVICLEGLGRYEHGLVGDLGLVKLCSRLLGRRAEAEDTTELLAGYDDWAGLASVYLLASSSPAPSPLYSGYRGRYPSRPPTFASPPTIAR